MDKGQHLRLVFVESNTNKVIALATDLSLNLSAQTEDSTTKDTTDTNGTWNEYDVTSRSGDIQFSALIGVGTDTAAKSFNDIINQVNDALVNWKIVMVSGANNRVVGKTVCSGQGKVTNVQGNGQNRQKATYSGTVNIYGSVTVGSD